MTTNKKLTTLVSFILDRSGSMEAIKEATISGFNEYINGLKKQEKGKMLFSLTTFDTESIDQIYDQVPIKQIEPLTDKTYDPRSGTPLYDATVDTIEKLAEKVDKIEIKPAVLVAIMTDGEENSSKEHDANCLKDLIKKLERQGNYTFVYLGANQDSWTIAQKFGIQKGNIANWTANATGINNAFMAMATSTVNYSNIMADNSNKGIALNASKFFNKEEGGVL